MEFLDSFGDGLVWFINGLNTFSALCVGGSLAVLLHEVGNWLERKGW